MTEKLSNASVDRVFRALYRLGAFSPLRNLASVFRRRGSQISAELIVLSGLKLEIPEAVIGESTVEFTRVPTLLVVRENYTLSEQT